MPHISLPVATAAQHVQCESTPSRANHEAALLGSVNDSKSRLERELDLQTKVDRLGEQLKQAERAAAAKESALQAQNERLLALDAQSSKTVLRLQSQNNETCRKIRALETDLSAQQSSHEKQVQSLEEYEARTSKERAEELIRAEAERTRQVNHAKRELQTCRVELQQSRSAFDALNESSETKMTSLKAELEQARKKTAIKEAAFNKQSNQFLAQISQMDASNLRIQDQYDQTCQRVLSLEVELRAEKSAHNDKILCTESSWSKYMRDREEEMREVMARLEEKIDEVNRAKTSLQECQVQCNKFSSMTDTLVTENQALERNLAESAKKILELEELGSEMRAEMERLEGKIPILEQELESAKAKEDDQEQKIYGTEVQLINSQGLHEREMKHKYDELLRLQGVVLRSASNADLVFSGKKLSAGSYITMHIALHTEFGVETWVRYIAEEDALEAVESLGLCTENHRCKFDLAFPPNYDIVTGQLVQEPTRLADVWKREGELWQWSKSIQQPVRSFIDGYKKSLLPRGQKRKSPVEGDVRNRAQRSRRRGKAPLSVIEDGPTRLAIEAPNVDLSSRR